MMINGQLVLVSGASSGIGAATAKVMAKAGGRVVLLARRKEALDQVAAEITSASGQAWAYSVDLADADAVAAVAKQITEELGTPDIIINNAGAGRWLFVDETSPAEAVQMMAVPYFAAFNVTHAFLPAILRRNSGHIVNISSVGSRFVWPGATRLSSGPVGGTWLYGGIARGSGWDGDRSDLVREWCGDITLLGAQSRES